MISQDDIISYMTKRIEILVNEVNSLTEIINNNIND